jgi:hypothetical protein
MENGPVAFSTTDCGRITGIPEGRRFYNIFLSSFARLDSRGRLFKIPTTRGFNLMCRNIKTLFNFDPPVTDEEVRAASLQFVRKITGFNKPSKANEASFLGAIEEVAAISTRLLRSLETTAAPKNREEEAAKARARAAERFGD